MTAQAMLVTTKAIQFRTWKPFLRCFHQTNCNVIVVISWHARPSCAHTQYPLSTEARSLRDHWATTKFDTQWALNDLQGLPWFLSDLSVNTMDAMVSIQFKIVSQWSLREADFSECSVVSQRALNGLTSLSMISQQSFNKHNILVNSLGHSVISVDRSWSLSEHRRSHNERSMNSQWLHVGLLMNAQRSPRSLRGHLRSPWNLLKIEFLVPQWVLKVLLECFHRNNFLGGLGDCWDILPSFDRSTVAQWSASCGKGA